MPLSEALVAKGWMTAKEARDAELTLELWVRDARESKLPPLSQVPLIRSDVSLMDGPIDGRSPMLGARLESTQSPQDACEVAFSASSLCSESKFPKTPFCRK